MGRPMPTPHPAYPVRPTLHNVSRKIGLVSAWHESTHMVLLDVKLWCHFKDSICLSSSSCENIKFIEKLICNEAIGNFLSTFVSC